MKKRSVLFAWLLSAAMLFGLLTGPFAARVMAEGESQPSAEESADAAQQDIVILFTNDIHCGVTEGFGLTGLWQIRDYYKKQGMLTLLVDCGDQIQGEALGTVTKGDAMIELMNDMEYDAAIPGDHEFDYGMDRFFELVGKADFPYISCNFNKEGEMIFDPYRIIETGGKKIAFVGVTTPLTRISSTPRNFQDENGNYIYDFLEDSDGTKLFEAVQSAVDSARQDGADYVIVLGHMGNVADAAPYNYMSIIENTTGIDAFLDGHSHDTDQVTMKDKDGNTVIRSSTGTKMLGVGWLKISAKDGSLTSGLYTWSNSTSAPELLEIDNIMAEAVAEKEEQLGEEMKKVVAKTAVDLVINDPKQTDAQGAPIRIVRRAETNLGDLIADAFRQQLDADIGIINGGAIRAGITAGDITMNDLINVLPFGNQLSKIEVTGQQFLDALEWGAKDCPSESGGFLQVSGVTYEIHTYIESSCTSDDDGFTGVSGEYRVKNVTIGGEPLDPEKTYTLAGIDYTLKNDGDGFTMFKDCNILMNDVKLDNQTFIDYVTDNLGGVIGDGYEDPYGDGRIVAVDEEP